MRSKQWLTDELGRKVAVDYLEDVYTSTSPTEFENLLDEVPTFITT